MSVLNKDRERDVEYFRLAMTLADIQVNYETADLIYELHRIHKRLGDKMTVKDAVKIRAKNEEKWLEYHREKSKLEFKPNKDTTVKEVPKKTELSKWLSENYDKCPKRVKGVIQSLIGDSFGYLKKYYSDKPLYIEDITKVLWLDQNGAGNWTWEQFKKVRGY